MKNLESLVRFIFPMVIIVALVAVGCKRPGGTDSPHNLPDGTAGNGWPLQPPVRICGNTKLLTGPASPPAGAVVVPAGNNSKFNFNRAGVTFWFATGIHTLGTDAFSQIIPANNSTFIGGPGAILDGQHKNNYAFTQRAANVTIRYLTIRNFVAPLDQGVVNHDAGNKWTIEYNTIHNNEGAGLMAGPNNIYRYNCIKDNGQYGINSCCGTETHEVENFVLDHNEIVGNNTGDWEKKIDGCGCTGAHDINLEMGVSLEKQELCYSIFNEPALNTFSPDKVKEYTEVMRYKVIGEKKVATWPLSEILDKYLPDGTAIDFFTIDAEGLDIDVLRSNNWDKYRPAYVLVESKPFELAPDSGNEISAFMYDVGYRIFAKTYYTYFFKRTDS